MLALSNNYSVSGDIKVGDTTVASVNAFMGETNPEDVDTTTVSFHINVLDENLYMNNLDSITEDLKKFQIRAYESLQNFYGKN